MHDEERRIIEARLKAINAALVEFRDQPWQARAAQAAVQLTAIHDDWWTRHKADLGAYARDLSTLNELAGWRENYTAVTSVVHRENVLTLPPKFFGGDPALLHQDFVLAISLNHKTPKDSNSDEVTDFQTRDACLQAHRHYFRQAYVYRRFFAPRATVLSTYAAARKLSVPEDWRAINEQYSLYLEGYPTFSQNFREPRAPRDRLEDEVFVMALNRLAHKVVLGLLRPRAVLLAGRATWSLLMSSNPIQVEPKCLGTLDHVALDPLAAPCAVLRCNFLRTVYGPNTTTELEELGRLLGN